MSTMAKSRREEQVEHALGTRRRQAARVAAIEDLIGPIEHDPDFGECADGKDLRTHHGWGVCVKTYEIGCRCEMVYGRFACSCGYEIVRETFWEDVEHIASEYDFAIRSEGRSGGYVVINRDSMPSLDDIWPRERTEFFRERLAPFVLDVREYQAGAIAAFKRGEHISGEKIATMLAESA